MGFSDFSWGYLLGQSLAPNGTEHIIDESNVDKKEWDKKCDEAYWRAWDRGFKDSLINGLRFEGKGARFTYKQIPIYPSMTPYQQADLIESGELKIVVFRDLNSTSYMWTDETRPEAQDEKYLKLREFQKEAMKKSSNYRIF